MRRTGVAATGKSPPETSSHALNIDSPGFPICVTGMGRCGTSLTTALIGLLGVDLGPTERMLPTDMYDNARGYWEQREIYEINEEILRAFGGAWERPPDLPPGWERSPALAAVRDRARSSLIDLFGTAEKKRWAWKDPRASVTLPFWRDLIGEMDYVLCVRNPVDVAASLAKRDIKGLKFDDSVALWLHYVRASLENTQGHRRLILCYEDYFTDTDRQIQRLAEFVCGPGTQLSDDLYESVRSFIEPGLWHNRDSVEETNHARAISPKAADLYACLHARGGQQSASGHDARHQSLLAGWSVSRVWWLALILSSTIAATDAMLSHVILIPLLAAGPLCGLLTGRWVRTATVGIWAVALAILLGIPDEIWGTHLQLVYLGFVAAASLLSISAATVIQKGRYPTQ